MEKHTLITVLLAPVCFHPTESGIHSQIFRHLLMRIQGYLAITATDCFLFSKIQHRSSETATVMARVNSDVIQEKVVCFTDQDQHPCYLTAGFHQPRRHDSVCAQNS